MNLFFDTSALVKFFHEEEWTDIVTDLILEQKNEVRISDYHQKQVTIILVLFLKLIPSFLRERDRV